MLYLAILVLVFVGCGGQSGSDRDCVVQASPTQLTDRIALAQCGDGSICIGACGGTQDSNNPTRTSDDDTTGPTDSNNRTINN